MHSRSRGTGLLTTVGVALGLVFSLAFTTLALGFVASSALSGKWADALSAVQDGVGGLIGLVVVAYLWRRYGFTRVKESLSLAALEHDEAGKRYWELHLSEPRLATAAAQAELAARRATGLDHERLQAKANEARAVATRVAGEAGVAKGKFVDAIRALLERYPNDAELADELARYSAPPSEHDPGERRCQRGRSPHDHQVVAGVRAGPASGAFTYAVPGSAESQAPVESGCGA
jgi:hypothetical protein